MVINILCKCVPMTSQIKFFFFRISPQEKYNRCRNQLDFGPYKKKEAFQKSELELHSPLPFNMPILRFS